jgi:hypothetical protein
MSKSFYRGAIIKMDVAERSHVTEPYYVECLFYNPNARHGEVIMITGIPGHHETEMTVGNSWDYHKPRMTVIGNKSDHGHLILNQKIYHK